MNLTVGGSAYRGNSANSVLVTRPSSVQAARASSDSEAKRLSSSVAGKPETSKPVAQTPTKPTVSKSLATSRTSYVKPQRKIEKVSSGTTDFTTIKKVTAEETNSWWKNVMGYSNPPYKPGTMVEEIKLEKDTTFVRVYDGKVSGMYGGWVMKAEDIKGLTPKQIKDKFALPALPKYMADVKFTKGTTIRKGIVNPLDGWGKGGGIQYDLMGQRVGEFLNPRELPE